MQKEAYACSQCFLERQLNDTKPRAVRYQIRAVLFNQGHSASQETLGNVWRHLGCNNGEGVVWERWRGAPGIEWVEARTLLNVLQCPGRPSPQRIIWPHISKVAEVKKPLLRVERKLEKYLGWVIPIPKHTGMRFKTHALPAMLSECVEGRPCHKLGRINFSSQHVKGSPVASCRGINKLSVRLSLLYMFK